MYLIEACPVPTPADAERLLADLWQLTTGRGLGLLLVGVGDRIMLGVTAAHPAIAESATTLVADQCGGAVESGWLVGEVLGAAVDVAAINLVPTERNLAVESRAFGWQRSDPLRAAFLALESASPEDVAGVALGLRALPDLCFAFSLGVFAAGRTASARAVRLAASLGGIGVRVRRPLRQRRAAQRMVRGVLRRPLSVQRVEAVARFWHPPLASDTDLQVAVGRATDPAGYLTPGPST